MVGSKLTCSKWHFSQVGHGGKKAIGGVFLVKLMVKKVEISCSENIIHDIKNGTRKPLLKRHKRIIFKIFNIEFKYQYMANCNPNRFNKKNCICLSFQFKPTYKSTMSLIDLHTKVAKKDVPRTHLIIPINNIFLIFYQNLLS